MEQRHRRTRRIELLPQVVLAPETGNRPARGAGEDEVVGAFEHGVQGGGTRRLQAEQVRGDAEEVPLRLGLEERVEGKVVGEARIAQDASVDLHGREGGQDGRAGEDVLRPDLLAGRVEVDLLAGLDVDAADRQAGVAPVQALEVDEAVQGAEKRLVVEQRHVVRHPWQGRPQARQAMAEDAGRPQASVRRAWRPL